jgi:putative addiction module killer protein
MCCLLGNIYGIARSCPLRVEYEDSDGRSPFDSWFDALDTPAAAKVSRSVARLEAGLKPDVKPVGKGVHEARIRLRAGLPRVFRLRRN